MRQGGPEILAPSGIHKTKAGSFKLSQRYSFELSYWRYGQGLFSQPKIHPPITKPVKMPQSMLVCSLGNGA